MLVMNKAEKMSDRQYLFGVIFIVANRVDTMLEREFKRFGITTKQWFLSVIIQNLFDEPPTIKEVAKEMGSSHQNVKQVALKLQQKGLLILKKDKKDARITRLNLSESSYDFWTKLRGEGTSFTGALFKNIEKDELEVARRVMQKMQLNINEMDNKNGGNSSEEV
jgi:DNA-binding MarR family transcriptional regulator